MIIQDAYSKDTGEHIPTDTPAAWMGRAGIAAPVFDRATAGCFWRNGAWVIVVSTAQADAHAKEKAAVLDQTRAIRANVLNALTGIAGRAVRSGDTTGIAAACDAAAIALANITADPAAVAATDGASTHAAIMAAWKTILANLTLASQPAAVAFKGVAM